MNTFAFRLVPVVLALSVASPAHALSPVASTLDAKLCPDGVTYVGRDGSNNCEWQKCPGEGITSAFRDVSSDHPNAEAITYVKEQGIVEGYVDGTFKPDATINRAEFVKILVHAMLGHEPGDFEPECFGVSAQENGTRLGSWAIFPDVSESDWFALHVCAAWHDALVSGYPDGTFRPANPINFVEAAKILANTFDIAAPGMAQDDAWYKPYVMSLERANAIPTSIASFDALITRGEMAEMIYRLKAKDRTKPSKAYEELANGENVFYLDALAVGKTFGGMTVKEYVADESVSFEGSVTLAVEYNDLRHGDFGMMPAAVCVEPVTDPSVRRLPVQHDNPNPWFCFESSPLLNLFPKGTGGIATVVIDRYHVNLIGAEIANQARLAKVLSVEATKEMPSL